MTPDNVQALPVGTLLGDYRLDAVIGHGGFGITYRAFDSQLAKVVAIKEYLPVEFAVRQGDKVVARGARFAVMAWLLRRYGEPIREFIEKRLGLLAALGAAVLIALYVAVRYFRG
jgi:serine/threonine protein kinase